MSTKLEQIEMLRERTQVSYEKAKEALERCNGDVVDALIYLEKDKKIKPEPGKKSHNGYGFIRAIKNLIRKGNKTKFTISKGERTTLAIPVTLMVIITLIAPYLTAAGILIALFTEHTFRFVKESSSDADINKTLVRVSSAVAVAKDKLFEDKPVN